jgi:hypothetical protein
MNELKRMLAVGASAALLLGSLAGCSGSTTDQADSDAVTVEDACMEIFGLPGDTVVATINGQDLLLSEYSYWLSYDANMLGYYYYGSLDAISWDDTYTDDQTVADFVKQDALSIAVNYMVLEQQAKELGLELTDEQQASVDSTMDSYVTSFGTTLWDAAVEDGTVVEDDYDDEAKAAWIQEQGEADLQNEVAIYGTTVDYLRYMAEIYQYYTAIQDSYFSEDTVTDDTMAGYVEDNSYYCAKSILFMNTTDADGNTVAYADMDDDQKAALKEEAQAALEDILSSEDPDAKFDEYQANRSDDTGSNYEGGYYLFTDGDMVDEYYQAVAALEVGDISAELVESENYGYFIVARLAVDYDDVPIDYSSNGYSLRDLYISESFGNLIDQWNDEADIVTNETFDSLDMASFATNLQALADKLYPSDEEDTEDADAAEDSTEDAAEETEDSAEETESAE